MRPLHGYRTDRHAALVDEPTVVLLSYLEGGEHIGLASANGGSWGHFRLGQLQSDEI